MTGTHLDSETIALLGWMGKWDPLRLNLVLNQKERCPTLQPWPGNDDSIDGPGRCVSMSF